ncbi:sensor histidine kinase [Salmonella enterica subsp. enterica]|uniref:Sensor histidine kinase n=1 Tax=Salmonella enterica I TaxID=59201 RepID=A0A447U5Q0_SALET|nr:sensor histidine kinase [Salmonella enterica subsp. enterica]
MMLSQERSAEEYQQALVDNIEELEGLSRLTENILFLARAEHQNIAVKKTACFAQCAGRKYAGLS